MIKQRIEELAEANLRQSIESEGGFFCKGEIENYLRYRGFTAGYRAAFQDPAITQMKASAKHLIEVIFEQVQWPPAEIDELIEAIDAFDQSVREFE